MQRFPPGCWLGAQRGRWGCNVTFPVHHLPETNTFQGCISIPPHQCFSSGKALWRRFMCSSQLPHSLKFRVLRSRSNSWLWFILQWVHPEAELIILLLLSHRQWECSSHTPQNTSALLAFAPAGKDPVEPRASPAPQSAQGCSSPPLPAASICKDPSRVHRTIKSFADLQGPGFALLFFSPSGCSRTLFHPPKPCV